VTVTSDDKDTASEDAEPRAGERLRSAREARAITVEQIAKELHLDEPKVHALERNEFSVLGAPVFAKGHLRKYAELVGVSVDDIMSDYYRMNRSEGAPPVVGPRKSPQRNLEIGPSSIGIILAVIVAIAVLGVLYWWFTRAPNDAADVGADNGGSTSTPAPFIARDTDTAVSSDPATTEVVRADSSEVEDTVDESAEDGSPTEVDTSTLNDSTASAASADLSAAESGVRLTLSFSGDCWTEVSDASGQRLFYDSGEAGRVINLSGEAPLRIVFGNADNVSMEVDGRDFPIPASARRGRLARLTVGTP